MGIRSGLGYVGYVTKSYYINWIIFCICNVAGRALSSEEVWKVNELLKRTVTVYVKYIVFDKLWMIV